MVKSVELPGEQENVQGSGHAGIQNSIDDGLIHNDNLGNTQEDEDDLVIPRLAATKGRDKPMESTLPDRQGGDLQPIDTQLSTTIQTKNKLLNNDRLYSPPSTESYNVYKEGRNVIKRSLSNKQYPTTEDKKNNTNQLLHQIIRRGRKMVNYNYLFCIG